MSKTILFTVPSTVRGMHYQAGDAVELDNETADVYVATDRARELTEEEADELAAKAAAALAAAQGLQPLVRRDVDSLAELLAQIPDLDIGSAAIADVADFATAAQGATADTAMQPGDDAADLGSGEAEQGHVLTADGDGVAAWAAAGGAGGSLTLTYTGTPQTVLVLPVTMASIAVVPIAAVVGQATYTAIAGPVIESFLYSENNLPLGNRLTTLSFDDLVGVEEAFSPSYLAALTSLSLPTLVAVGGNFQPQEMASLTTLSAPSLLAIGSAFDVRTMNSLVTLTLPALVSTGAAFQIFTMTSLTTLSVPSLVSVGTRFSVLTAASLTTLTAPALVLVGTVLQLDSLGSLVTASFPELTIIGTTCTMQLMASLTTISLPKMIRYGSTIAFVTSLGNVTTVTLGTIGTLKEIGGATINISGQKLTAATVNAILALLVSLDGTNDTTLWGSGKTLNVSGGTSSAPTGQGITDKATLQARGATITTN